MRVLIKYYRYNICISYTYPINKVISHNAYSLELRSSFGHTHPVFSVVLLRPYEEDPVLECHTPLPPPPIIQDGVPE